MIASTESTTTLVAAVPASQMLEWANNTHLLGGHFVENKHYASLGEDLVYIWQRSYFTPGRGWNTCFIQSLDVSEARDDVATYSYELKYEIEKYAV